MGQDFPTAAALDKVCLGKSTRKGHQTRIHQDQQKHIISLGIHELPRPHDIALPLKLHYSKIYLIIISITYTISSVIVQRNPWLACRKPYCKRYLGA